MRTLIILLFSVSTFVNSYAQDVKSFIGNKDASYFNFLEGLWRQEIDGKVKMNGSYFEFKKGSNPYSFIEYWYNVLDTNVFTSNAIRSWDKTGNKWMFSWQSDNNLFQVWEGRKYGEDWYITRDFNINGDKYLSRQGFIAQGDGRMMRISEKSYDDGKTWQVRFKETYKKIVADDKGVTSCLENYLFGDSLRLASAFHTNASMKFIDAKTGEMMDVLIASYIARVSAGAGKPDPAIKKRIISYQIRGDAAQAELEIKGADFITHDFMNLLKTGSGWKIVSKIFYREQAPKS